MAGSEHTDALRQALVAVRDLRSKLGKHESAKSEPIAIVGMACRFPGGAVNPEAYWELLRDGNNALVEVPQDRWDINGFFDPDPEVPGKMYTRVGGFLREPIDRFDPQFFGITPREAECMDPQQRLLLEVSWEALESAGQAPDSFMGSPTGVFLGVSTADYNNLRQRESNRTDIDPYFHTGVCYSVAAGRISYALGLQGPCFPIDTACSSSLVAVSQAMNSLRRGDCDMALAAGVNLMLDPDTTIFFCKLRALSPSGPCRTFDAAADGYARGEGCGVIVLKRLGDALEHGDNILALLRGSHVNHDGRSSGLTTPNGRSQQQVMRRAFDHLDIEPRDVGYIEAHGTGTVLGDPVEAQSISRVFENGRSIEDPLRVGSVKTNLGHLEAAAGIASIIKVVLCLKNEIIPPHLHFNKINPHIAEGDAKFEIPTEAIRWPAGNSKRIAGVNSFGISGTNAHILIEEAPREKKPIDGQGRHILTLRAKDKVDLASLAQRFQKHLSADRLPRFSDICHTANSGRAKFNHRLALMADSAGDASRIFSTWEAGKVNAAIWQGEPSNQGIPKIAFVFSSEAPLHFTKYRKLYQTAPAFRGAVQECEELVGAAIGESVLEVLNPDIHVGDICTSNELQNAAVFTLDYALAAFLQACNVAPNVVYGEGIGECVAAVVAGLIPLEDGVWLALRDRDALPKVERKICYRKPQRIMIASLTGGRIATDQDLSDEYWVGHTKKKANYTAVTNAIVREHCSLFVESGSGMFHEAVFSHLEERQASDWLSCLGSLGDDEEPMLETLARLFVQGVDIDWNQVSNDSESRKVLLPTYPFKSQHRYWFSEDSTVKEMENPEKAVSVGGENVDEFSILDQITQASPNSRSDLMFEYLRGLLVRILRMEEAEISPSSDIHSLGLDSLMAMDLIAQLKDDLKLPIYPREIYAYPVIEGLSRYLTAELERVLKPASEIESPKGYVGRSDTDGETSFPEVPPKNIAGKNRKVALILSAPRSGSTLLRVMLAGHPDVFAPPELHLLQSDNLQQWQDRLGGSYLDEGLLRAFMELKGIDADQAREQISILVKRKAGIGEVYDILQQEVGGRLLVDKSPSYAGHFGTLQRAEALIDEAYYICLIRHPYAVVESYVRNRMDRLTDSRGTDPYQTAEEVWTVSNRNMMRLMANVDAGRSLIVRFEDLVTDPEATAKEVCSFLDLPYDTAMIRPYDGDRMTDGATHKSMAIGDPNFLTRDHIDSNLAEVWRSIFLPRPLGENTCEVACHYGYDLLEGKSEVQDKAVATLTDRRESYVELSGLSICVCEWGSGDGPTILCLHGLLDQGMVWDGVAQLLVKKGFSVIAPDFRGHGKSQHSPLESPYQLLDFVTDMDALIRHLDRRIVAMVGHSMGAVVAGLLVAARPMLAEKLIFVEPPAIRPEQRKDGPQFFRAYLDYVATVPVHPVFPDFSAASERLRKIIPSLTSEESDRLASRITVNVENGVVWTWDARLRTRSGVLFDSFHSTSDYVKSLVQSIEIPCGSIFGSNSELKDQETFFDESQYMKRKVTVDGGHHPHLDVPSEVTEIICGDL